MYDLIKDYPKREGNWIRKMTPPTLLGLAGILPGLIGTWLGNANPIQGLTFKQPLLLYRLFPNSTYGQGILLGAAITFLPMLLLLIWILAAGKWKTEPLARAAMLVSLGGFLLIRPDSQHEDRRRIQSSQPRHVHPDAGVPHYPGSDPYAIAV